jgi:lipoyl(octanoyl) transferase
VGYPILDLREWKRDVHLYVRALEQVLIDTLADFGIPGERVPGCTGVWVGGAKLAAIGVHISRWVTSHGFAFNLNPDLQYFQYIVPCGIAKPVTSMEQLGVHATGDAVAARIEYHFARNFDFEFSRTDGDDSHGRRSNAPDGRKHCGRYADPVAEESGRSRRAG